MPAHDGDHMRTLLADRLLALYLAWLGWQRRQLVRTLLRNSRRRDWAEVRRLML